MVQIQVCGALPYLQHAREAQTNDCPVCQVMPSSAHLDSRSCCPSALRSSALHFTAPNTNCSFLLPPLCQIKCTQTVDKSRTSQSQGCAVSRYSLGRAWIEAIFRLCIGLERHIYGCRLVSRVEKIHFAFTNDTFCLSTGLETVS